ncbi:hypothetical protein BDB01DRAFT_852630 [Pilobolus umbonatus]|nr:hypothetical protein BDB01DRAFT_852630 [Pilobolus umbonatus]
MKAWLSGWTNFALPTNIQKRLYKFLLRKALGQFLENDLDLHNFDIELVNGSVELRDLNLNLQTLNDLLGDVPLILEEGKVACISASLPWANFWSGDITLKIQGLQLQLRPIKDKPRKPEPECSMEETILSSSLHFADDFLRTEIEEEQAQLLNESIQQSFQDYPAEEMEGLQVLTRVIDKMLAKIKIDIVDTQIKIIHKSSVLSDREQEYSLEINVPKVSYFDETPEFSHPPIPLMDDSILLPPLANETIKYITVESPTVWLRSREDLFIPTQDLSETEFYDTTEDEPYEALLFTTLDQRNWIRIKLRPLDEAESLIKQVDFMMTHFQCTITPPQLAFFMEFLQFIQPTQSPSCHPQPTKSSQPHKMKIRIARIEFILAYSMDQHIRLAIDGLNINTKQTEHSILDIRISQLHLDEYRGSYQPILQFNSLIQNQYPHDELFPSYIPQSTHEPHKADVIKLKRINKKTKHRDMITLEEDINIDFQSFIVFIDPTLIDRLEGYVYVLMALESTRPRPPAMNIMEDLESQECEKKRKVKASLPFIRIQLMIPAHSQYDENQLSVDICHCVCIASQPEPIKIALDFAHVFMKLEQNTMAHSWFTTRQGIEDPSIEITLSDTLIPSTSGRSGYFGAGSDIPTNLFDYLSHHEYFQGDQKLHLPMEEQSRSAMIFQQRTIETSLFVLNCYFPQTYMNLSKQVWDQVQMIQNDVLSCQPKCLQSSPGSNAPATQQNLLSVIVVMSQGVWDLRSACSYRFQFSEFRYFAAIKHLGRDENITTLDIEDFTLDDITHHAAVPLLMKTMPAPFNPRRNTSMISLLSRVTFEGNKVNKMTSVVGCNVCWKLCLDNDFIQQIVEFQKMPDDLVLVDPPVQYIKVYAHVLDTVIDYEPIYSPIRSVIVLDGVQVITDIIPDQPQLEIRSYIQYSGLYIIDDKQELVIPDSTITDIKTYWNKMGLGCNLSILNVEFVIKIRQDEEHINVPETEMTLYSLDFHLNTTADSFQTLINLVTYLSNQGDFPEKPTKTVTTTAAPIVDMLAHIEENAFKSAQHDMSHFAWIEVPDTMSQINEDVIHVLSNSPLEMIENYFAIGDTEKKRESHFTSGVKFSLRLNHANVHWKLYDGSQWNYLEGAMDEQASMECVLEDINLDLDTTATSVYLRLLIKEMELIDHLPSSNYKKFFGYASEKPREKESSMMDLTMMLYQEEVKLKLKLLPVRLFVDQDALQFLVKFFTFDTSYLRSTSATDASIPPLHLSTVTDEEEETVDKDPLFFQFVDIYPIELKVDYKPKYVNYGNIKEGQYAELVNLFHLDGAEMKLTHVKLSGIKGVHRLVDKLEQAWVPHIKQTQVSHMVSGVSPIRSLVNLSTGVADLVLLPIQQYRKDGRIMKGIQRGTESFARATAIEAIKLSSRVASGTQVILEHADGFFSHPEDSNEPNPTIYAVPIQEKSNVIKAVPIAVIKPMIGLTGGFQSILTGLRRSIDPVMRLQSEDKYKKRK